MKRIAEALVSLFALVFGLIAPTHAALNSFNKEERVAFEQLLEGFEDALVLSRDGHVSRYATNMESMERQADIIWRPQPYIMQTFDGMDQTANFQNATQLSVPATLGYQKSAPWIMDALELRDALQEGRLGDGAKQKLASDVNVAVSNVAALQGTLVVKRTVAASGFDDVALCEAIMNEQGVPGNNRVLSLGTRDYNGMASNLAGRQTLQPGKTLTAYERAYVGQIASFDTFKLDYAYRKAAALGGGGITISTLAAGGNIYTPKATSVATTGERSNVDNRYQRVTVSSTTSVIAGDAFTIAALDAVHHITKGDTGQLKTFRVISVDSSTTMTISPPIVSAQGATDAELQYQNCINVTPASNAAIVFLNTVTAPCNPFWQKDAIEILPGRYAVPTDAGSAVMRATTENGIELTFQKWYDIKVMKTLFRLDCLFGVCMKQPEMAGLVLFNQT